LSKAARRSAKTLTSFTIYIAIITHFRSFANPFFEQTFVFFVDIKKPQQSILRHGSSDQLLSIIRQDSSNGNHDFAAAACFRA
jgi:hypothetical protein